MPWTCSHDMVHPAWGMRMAHVKHPEKNGVKGGCWDIPAFIVGCYGFYVYVQCLFLPFDFLRGGGFGTILPLTFTVDVWFRWGGYLFRLLEFYVFVWVGDCFIIFILLRYYELIILCFPFSYSIPPEFVKYHWWIFSSLLGLFSLIHLAER